MVGSDIDQKYLGIFAKETAETKPELSAALYKILGLSTLLYRKIVRARKQRKLDPTRSTRSLDLYKHIIWMAREGHTILDAQVIPAVSEFTELRVLAYKLKASFLHIFVLFDQTYNAKNMLSTLSFPPGSPNAAQQGLSKDTNAQTLNPINYVSPTIDAFIKADDLATKLLPGIHPLRLSVKLEFSAFTYDCTRDHEASRRLAMRGIDEALEAMNASDDDETFDEASQLIGSLAVMAQRGLSPKPNKHSPRINANPGASPTQQMKFNTDIKAA